MQDYEQYARISHAPVILPPAGTEKNEEPAGASPGSMEEAAETGGAPDLFSPRIKTVHLRGRRKTGNRVLLVQAVLSALVLAALLALRAAAPQTFESVKNWYNDLLYREITVTVETPSSAPPVSGEN